MKEAPFRGFFFVRRTAKMGVVAGHQFSVIRVKLADRGYFGHALIILTTDNWLLKTASYEIYR